MKPLRSVFVKLHFEVEDYVETTVDLGYINFFKDNYR